MKQILFQGETKLVNAKIEHNGIFINKEISRNGCNDIFVNKEMCKNVKQSLFQCETKLISAKIELV